MTLYNRHLAQLDSRVRGNDGCAQANHSIFMPMITAINHVTSAQHRILAFHAIPASFVIPANAGIHSRDQLSQDSHPESLSPAEDVKKIERRLASAQKKALKNPDSLENK